MIDGKTISAVMFIHNEEKYIEEAVLSIQNQTAAVDCTIIVDDYSTDNTLSIIHRLSESFDNIKILKGKKQGKSYACELGLMNVETDLFFICHGDDVLEGDYVHEMYNFISQSNLKYAYPNYVITDEKLRPIKFSQRRKPVDKYKALIKHDLSGYLFGYKEVIDILMPFPNGLSFEDWYISSMLSQQFGENHVHNKILFKYRRHKNADTYNAEFDRKKYFSFLHRAKETLKIIRSRIVDGKSLDIIEERIFFYESLLNYDVRNSYRIIRCKYITLRDILSFFFFPLTVSLKYK